ncbi:MAG: insulinase family protein, partial [Deltaproteobacteria bacterium]|nr:insulinase family protein [Deltaproteobacteria bacterium]
MKILFRKCLFPISFAFLAAFFSSAAWGAEVFKTRLDNGMTVIIEEEHTAPVAAIEMWVRTGGADESGKEAGIAHVFEHMLFKGTKKRKVGEIARVVEAAGGDINAYTSFDNTVFHLALPSKEFTTGLDVLSDAVQNSAFDPEELRKELQVVLEEIRMNEDSPGRSLYKSILSSAFSVHPYGRPVIGYKNTVEPIKRADMMAFFKKWYIPNNMTLVIAGDIKKDDALSAVKAAFRGFKKGPDPHRKRP